MSSPLEFQEITSEAGFNPLTIDPRTPFTQAWFYGEWQEALGRRVRRFKIQSGPETLCFLQIITYPLARGKKYLYAPYGPVVKEFSGDLLALLREKLTELAKKENAVFVRLDFMPTPNGAGQALVEQFFKKAPVATYRGSTLQPRTEWILGLTESDDQLLKNMDAKTRYGIKTAEKRGVKVEIIKNGIGKYFEDFYALMKETSVRNTFGLHPKEYYRHIFENSEKRRNAYLTVARYGEKILVIDFLVVFGEMANYVFSGSSTEHRNLMPSYLAEWEAIRHARAINCKQYNFGGISGGRDTRREWEGITRFKKRFGGQELVHSDFYDVVIHPAWYYLYSASKLFKKFIP